MPTVSEKNTMTSRCVRLASEFLSGLLPCVTIFCFGLMLGTPGGLLMGRAATVVVRSLEFLTDNNLLMENLDNYIEDADFTFRASDVKNQDLSQGTSNDYLLNVFISVLIEVFGVFSLSLSLAVGVFVGLFVNELVIKKDGDTATGKALGELGCLLGVTATGYSLGWALEAFLSIASQISILMWIDISEIVASSFLFFLLLGFCCDLTVILVVLFLSPLTLPAVLTIVFTISFVFKTKLILMVALMPLTLVAVILRKPNLSRLTITPILLMLMVTDVFNFARQPIVALQSTTNTNSAVAEGLFIGILACQFQVVTVGVSFFVSSQKNGAGQISAGAAITGGALLCLIECLLPVLGPGPTIGALMGVAGAVGVTTAAAWAVTDEYGQVLGTHRLAGRLAVTVGTGMGAFLALCSDGGVLGVFMALCAASVPVGFYLEQLGWKLILHLCTISSLTMSV